MCISPHRVLPCSAVALLPEWLRQACHTARKLPVAAILAAQGPACLCELPAHIHKSNSLMPMFQELSSPWCLIFLGILAYYCEYSTPLNAITFATHMHLYRALSLPLPLNTTPALLLHNSIPKLQSPPDLDGCQPPLFQVAVMAVSLNHCAFIALKSPFCFASLSSCATVLYLASQYLSFCSRTQ